MQCLDLQLQQLTIEIPVAIVVLSQEMLHTAKEELLPFLIVKVRHFLPFPL